VIHDEATAVRRTESGFEVQLADDRLDADAVIVAAPAHRAARLVEDGELAALLKSIPYSSSIVGALIYHRPPFTRPLDGFGFLVPRKEARLLAACTWVNTKFDGRAPQNRALLRAFIAGEQALAAMASADSELAERIHSELDRLMRIAASPAESRLFRWERAMAQYPVGHSKIVESIDQRLEATPGLYLAGNAYEGIGIPDCIRRSRRIAETIGTR
jgi:oxygen-dependent protoporphyrinogen oxidase